MLHNAGCAVLIRVKILSEVGRVGADDRRGVGGPPNRWSARQATRRAVQMQVIAQVVVATRGPLNTGDSLPEGPLRAMATGVLDPTRQAHIVEGLRIPKSQRLSGDQVGAAAQVSVTQPSSCCCSNSMCAPREIGRAHV